MKYGNTLPSQYFWRKVKSIIPTAAILPIRNLFQSLGKREQPKNKRDNKKTFLGRKRVISAVGEAGGEPMCQDRTPDNQKRRGATKKHKDALVKRYNWKKFVPKGKGQDRYVPCGRGYSKNFRGGSAGGEGASGEEK